MGTGPVFLRAAAQGQRFLAIANLVDRPLVELVLRKDVADAAGITDKMPLAERAKALKGKTIAHPGRRQHRACLAAAGREPRRARRREGRAHRADGSARDVAGAENKAIDGYATSMPFTTQAVVKGSAVMLATATSDAPDLMPFAYGLVYAKPETCRDKREKCARMARALAGAASFIHEKPAEALEILRKRFDKLDPALLNAAWQVVSKAHAQDARVTVAGLENSQRVSLEAGLLEPKDALKSFDGLFTDEFLRAELGVDPHLSTFFAGAHVILGVR